MKLTNEEQRIAIAEVCGYQNVRKIDYDVEPGWRLVGDNRDHFPPGMVAVPDYLNDLNAMHEAEKRLTREQWQIYVDHIADGYHAESGSNVQGYEIVHATAAVRAEAFTKTIT